MEAMELDPTSSDANYMMGRLDLETCGGHSPNRVRARKHFEVALDQGHVSAAVRLGLLREEDGDLKEAKALYQWASSQGHAGAVVELGMLFPRRHSRRNVSARSKFQNLFACSYASAKLRKAMGRSG